MVTSLERAFKHTEMYPVLLTIHLFIPPYTEKMRNISHGVYFFRQDSSTRRCKQRWKNSRKMNALLYVWLCILLFMHRTRWSMCRRRCRCASNKGSSFGIKTNMLCKTHIWIFWLVENFVTVQSPSDQIGPFFKIYRILKTGEDFSNCIWRDFMNNICTQLYLTLRLPRRLPNWNDL